MTSTRCSSAAAALLLLSVGGCGNSPPSDFYVLTPMPQGERAAPRDEALVIGVGPVDIPDYLNRAQIVTRAGPNRLDVDEFNRWGGSLVSNLASVVAQNLSVLLGTDDVHVAPANEPVRPRYRVILSVTRLDGALGEDVTLDARWIVAGPRDRDQLESGRTVTREATGGADYQAYVAAQSRAIETLCRDIAADIAALEDAGR